ncbi:MAG: SDR family oxidoreductase [Synechococcales bacterium]|nr:SDR family oxidoreductase [Synechococcales bacterium]
MQGTNGKNRDMRTVLITGAGRGLGRELAIALAKLNYSLILVSRSQEFLDETHHYCVSLVPTKSIVMDLRDEAQIVNLGLILKETPIYLHAVINNAGMGEWSPIEKLSRESWDCQIETNLRGPFLVIRETLPFFKQQRQGLYVNVGSDCSLVGMPERGAYNASKYGLVGLTTSLRAELTGSQIHASLVFLGKTDTFFRNRKPGDRPGSLKPQDVAEAIAFVVDLYPRVVIEEISMIPPGGALVGVRSLI